MSETEKPTLAKQAAERLVAMLNRADELGGEIRDQLQEKMQTDERYIKARKAVARLLGKQWESPAEVAERQRTAEAKRKAAAASTAAKVESAARKAAAGFGDPSIKAQIFGKKSDPWSGRAITILERNKVDFDFVDTEEPEHEAKLVPLANETKQHTVPFIYLRGQFIGGFNALAEIERLGQLEYALMSAAEREKVPPHARFEIVPRPNTDEVVPAEENPGA
jgi:glutaredoxin